MKASQIKETLKKSFTAKRPLFIWGPPGVGKTSVVGQVAEELGLEFRPEPMVQRDPVDVRGLPSVQEQDGSLVTAWTRPDLMPVDGKGIVLLDDLSAAPPLVQVACYQLVCERRIGSHRLPDGWNVVASGNRMADRSMAQRMPLALANKFMHVDFDVDVGEWVTWALDNDVATEVIAFVRFRPELLHKFDPKKDERAFSTPRSLHILSDMLKAGGGSISYEEACGIVGEGTATEFMAFLKVFRELPDIDLVLMNPAGAEVPKDPATLYAVCGALAQKASTQNFGRMVEYANRLPPEFSVLLIRDTVRKDKSLALTRAFVEWTSKHSDVLM